MRHFRKRLIIWLSFSARLKLGIFLCLLAAFLGLYFLGNPLATSKTWSYWSLPLSGKTFVIDPGHGGPDGGAVSQGSLVEKQLNLAIALDLRDYLQQAGALVFMTRETDRDLADPSTKGLRQRKTEDLKRRVAFVQEKQAEFLISIHMNSIASSRWFGAQTFYDPSGHPDGEWIATLIQEELTENVSKTDRRANTVRNIYLLEHMTIPAVLVEAGFLSNPTEASLLNDRSYQQKLAAAIYRGILRYYSGEKKAPTAQEAK